VENTNGLLVVNKPAGMTSHDVVNCVRRIAQTRRVGHTGTLDPMATGVLVLVLGPATRLARFVSGCDKAYRAEVCLGSTTTTYDAEGVITSQAPVDVSTVALDAALAQFRGSVQQVPPMYSAIKIQGKKLYELARQGQEVARQPRAVTIHQLMLRAWDSPTLTLDIVCSPGTYIRSLAHDLGQVLGCGAHLTALTRTAVGAFTLAQSHTLLALAQPGALKMALQPPHTALNTMPAITLTPDQEKAARHGQTQALEIVAQPPWVQARDADGQLVAILIPVERAFSEKGSAWRPKLVFPKINQ